MLNCKVDQEILKKYLLGSLVRLHLMNESTVDMMDSAIIEGGIIEMEMMWKDLLGEDPPDKLKVLGREKKQLD